MAEFDDLFLLASSRYTEEQLSSPHPFGEHPQPTPVGEVRDRDGRMVLPGRERAVAVCTCPPFRSRLRQEVSIDHGRIIAARAETVAGKRDTKIAQIVALWGLRTLRDLGMRRGQDTSFQDDGTAANQRLASRVRQGVAPEGHDIPAEEATSRLDAWDRPMTEDETAHYAALFEKEMVEVGANSNPSAMAG